ncbi:DUF2959 domain-containing protein [Pseudidiomarina mangrovi]|uniref:DUF2959 domain-containing protein n=1 Tax=Pseudidiomarina mangrovi TaxID=2487133 RepID=UPI000FCA84A0|nr:DUF2959 domain-containing protein [Pseudidiomarina mangrovi]
MIIRTLLISCSMLALSGCSSAYYGAMEKLGYEKRDILVDRVEQASDAQGDAQETFQSALEQFQQVIGTPESELNSVYQDINSAFEDSQAAAKRVSDRIDQVEKVAEDLFDEWETELGEYSNANLRRQSEQQLNDTRRQYNALVRQMRQVESRMQPVLTAFQDQVLYLKHNLNAQAIGALKGELGRIESDVTSLIKNMQQSIAESEAFIARFKSP